MHLIELFCAPRRPCAALLMPRVVVALEDRLTCVFLFHDLGQNEEQTCQEPLLIF